MGVAVRLALAGLLATAAGAAGAVCEPRVRGLEVAELGGRLEVTVASAAAAGLAVGDVVLQVNASRPATCEGWADAVAAAARDRVALLVLVRRGDAQRAVALAMPAAAVVASSTPVGRATSTTTLPVDLLPDAVPVTRADVVALLGELGPERRTSFGAYRDAVHEARRALATLLVRDPGTADAALLRRLVRRHEAAVVAWAGVEAIRRRQGLRSSVPVSVGATESFFADSEVAVLIHELPALERTVRVQPSPGRITVAGRWEPMRALRLLWAEADALWAELVAGGGRD
jgi:hypothetical protein